MRPLPLVALLVLSAGCLGQGAPPVPTAPGACDGCEAPAPAPAVPAPDLPVGRAWTYRDDYLYDAEERITVVVARKHADGYLFAGGREEDVVSGAVWGRPWFGPVDASLNPAGWGVKLFDFPLHDGKSWEMREGLVVTAAAAEVRGAPGFVIEGADERTRTRIEWSGDAGYFVDYLLEIDGAPFLHLSLEAVETRTGWVHWEELAAADAWTDDPPAGPQRPANTLNVTGEADAVLVSLGGKAGGRAWASAPGLGAAQAWGADFPGEEDWLARAFPAEEGAWPLWTAAPPDGFAYARAVAVKWVRSDGVKT